MTDDDTDKTDEIRQRASDSDTLTVDGADDGGAVLTLDTHTGAPDSGAESEDESE